MRLAVFGGSTDTSHHVMQRALTIGYNVNMLVEPNCSPTITHENVYYITGDIHNARHVEHALENAHAIIGILDHLTEEEARLVVQAIIQGMKKYDLHRIMVSLGEHISRMPGSPLHMLKHSGLDWTIVRPLSVAKRVGRQLTAHHQPASPKSISMFMLNELLNVAYINKSVALST